VIAHFAKAVHSGAPFETTPEDNLLTLRLVEDAYRLSGWPVP
jgi:predicted dehydrogenase